MSDQGIFEHIDALVAEERELRDKLAKGEITVAEEHERLSAVQTELDRLWDLLRQRRAQQEFGGNPADAKERSGSTVENYES